ncbi:hypothetical protein PHYSODRAFT_331444 [Phytophthora sojae]|uniref:Uncharacterized protein n=1 Tax=Phytophthora sojae (strain P6497) TaxID=1094619 RepID=G4ZFG0_PHYSP|nr:hypothetical protein PHYSODRAFT_331444 [Phytophthora sojae]EGZ17476.1 hypothetical protein PHYSODRAFT_331444 [Phytophthora sojae]|eukprot:XP_009526534.1 hypothetical protein PHYSODRAFT_331444 [Phytophthora sojae]
MEVGFRCEFPVAEQPALLAVTLRICATMSAACGMRAGAAKAIRFEGKRGKEVLPARLELATDPLTSSCTRCSACPEVHRHAHNVVSALSLLIHLRLSRAKAAEIGARLPDSNPSQRENRW